MVKKLFILLLSIGIFVSMSSVWARAEDPQPELTVEKWELNLYEKLQVAQVYGVIETYQAQGKVLFSITAHVKPPWTETLKRLSVKYQDIVLMTPDGDKIPMSGYFNRYGEFKLIGNSLSKSRPSNWQKDPKPIIYNCVFAVPKGAKDLQLAMGTSKFKVDMPKKVEKTPLPSDVVKIEVMGASFVKTVVNEYSVGDLKPKPTATVESQGGRILEVKLRLTPLKSNGTSPQHFFWYSDWIGLTLDNGLYIHSFGEMFMRKLSLNVSHNLGMSGDKWRSTDATFYFVVPEGTKAFKIMYCNTPMADGKL